ncbi:MAG TPA: hypothetical protein VM146_18020 [Steroidobacteraceae bacterium]|nr:hypothetical protein [Steroidobacteraceae bacterium]
MQKTPTEREKLLADIERMLADAKDEASRRDLERLRDSLNSPQMIEMARDIESAPKRPPADLVLHFHAPLFPIPLTAAGCVLASAICLYAAMLAWSNPLIQLNGRIMNLWLIAGLFGALSVLFTAMSLKRSYFVRIDTEGMVTRAQGKRWSHLRAGDMRWKDLRALHEQDGVLEVRAASGAVIQVPQKLVNYKVLKQHLDNMVMLFGDRAG